jgi:ABC-type lipoprotein release transport system permease subunit
VVIVNQALARRYWPDRSAIGKHIKPVWMPRMAEIVGVVGNARYEGLSKDEASLDFYMPMAQWSVGAVTVVLKSPGPLSEATLRREVTAIDPTATIIQVRSMEDVLLSSAAPSRVTTTLIGLFAGMALLLGTIGVYGVLSYGVTQRRREIGIRMAIGAEPGEVRALVMRRAALLLGGGVAAGLLVAWLAASVLQGFVYGVGVRDPLTFAVVPLIFALVGFAASWLPARRATRVCPTEVMREE